eukprot:TRINITY_DN2814_c0_g2_i6.p1 TRINITY_DN2814_c0_g2~~TRINITY_DN2814_c0_g2_i6.p1  ORF type:complete len:224 (-),score=36.10 TRINITY_DN2814_c0_g2_i6:101-772(-)
MAERVGSVTSWPLTTSSQRDPEHSSAGSRLNFESKERASCWCAAEGEKNPWIYVTAPEPKKWVGVALQGRPGSIDKWGSPGAKGTQWVKSFSLHTSNDAVNWKPVEGGKVFEGVPNCETTKEYTFTPVVAKHLRLTVESFNWQPCLRWEAYCTAPEPVVTKTENQISLPRPNPSGNTSQTDHDEIKLEYLDIGGVRRTVVTVTTTVSPQYLLTRSAPVVSIVQ